MWKKIEKLGRDGSVNIEEYRKTKKSYENIVGIVHKLRKEYEEILAITIKYIICKMKSLIKNL
jgi:uncharacterized protein YeeX (DUF496 family)